MISIVGWGIGNTKRRNQQGERWLFGRPGGRRMWRNFAESNNFANFAIDMDSALAQFFPSHDALL